MDKPCSFNASIKNSTSHSPNQEYEDNSGRPIKSWHQTVTGHWTTKLLLLLLLLLLLMMMMSTSVENLPIKSLSFAVQK
jgi:hypothetical protein